MFSDLLCQPWRRASLEIGQARYRQAFSTSYRHWSGITTPAAVAPRRPDAEHRSLVRQRFLLCAWLR